VRACPRENECASVCACVCVCVCVVWTRTHTHTHTAQRQTDTQTHRHTDTETHTHAPHTAGSFLFLRDSMLISMMMRFLAGIISSSQFGFDLPVVLKGTALPATALRRQRCEEDVRSQTGWETRGNTTGCDPYLTKCQTACVLLLLDGFCFLKTAMATVNSIFLTVALCHFAEPVEPAITPVVRAIRITTWSQKASQVAVTNLVLAPSPR